MSRRTGTSIRIALRAVLAASENPGKEVVIVDHFGTHPASRFTLNICRDIISGLGLSEEFLISLHRNSISYIGR